MCVTYTDGTNTYTIGSRTKAYNITQVRVPMITHYMTTTEPYTAGKSNSYDYYIKADYYRNDIFLETIQVPVDSYGDWTMTPPTTVTPQIGDVIYYAAMWQDDEGTTIFSNVLQEHITR